MGTAVLTFSDLLAPLQALASHWLPGRRARRSRSANLRYVAIRPSCAPRSLNADTGAAVPARPLRVVRVVDPKASSGAGRVVISGRMADVCAELDRLAALEAQGATQALRVAH